MLDESWCIKKQQGIERLHIYNTHFSLMALRSRSSNFAVLNAPLKVDYAMNLQRIRISYNNSWVLHQKEIHLYEKNKYAR